MAEEMVWKLHQVYNRQYRDFYSEENHKYYRQWDNEDGPKSDIPVPNSVSTPRTTPYVCQSQISGEHEYESQSSHNTKVYSQISGPSGPTATGNAQPNQTVSKSNEITSNDFQQAVSPSYQVEEPSGSSYYALSSSTSKGRSDPRYYDAKGKDSRTRDRRLSQGTTTITNRQSSQSVQSQLSRSRWESQRSDPRSDVSQKKSESDGLSQRFECVVIDDQVPNVLVQGFQRLQQVPAFSAVDTRQTYYPTTNQPSQYRTQYDSYETPSMADSTQLPQSASLSPTLMSPQYSPWLKNHPVPSEPQSHDSSVLTGETQPAYPERSSSLRAPGSMPNATNTTTSLDKNYQIPGRPESFFKVGKVFAILWHENAGPNGTLLSENITTGRFNEPIFSTIRRMVVVKESRGHCLCSPISTYTGRATSKPGVDPTSHAIIYMSGTDPVRLKAERGNGMNKEAIAVDPAKGQKLDNASRINFAKINTVEYNIKVLSIGRVARISMPKLKTYSQEYR